MRVATVPEMRLESTKHLKVALKDSTKVAGCCSAAACCLQRRAARRWPALQPDECKHAKRKTFCPSDDSVTTPWLCGALLQ